VGKVLRRPQFVLDLQEVWDFIARDSEVHADRFVRNIEKRYILLSDNPSLGVARFPNYPGLRLFPYGNCIIIYQPLVDDQGIELIRLLHSARDYHRYFEN
jgi:toxin ParE1/3/4